MEKYQYKWSDFNWAPYDRGVIAAHSRWGWIRFNAKEWRHPQGEIGIRVKEHPLVWKHFKTKEDFLHWYNGIRGHWDIA